MPLPSLYYPLVSHLSLSLSNCLLGSPLIHYLTPLPPCLPLCVWLLWQRGSSDVSRHHVFPVQLRLYDVIYTSRLNAPCNNDATVLLHASYFACVCVSAGGENTLVVSLYNHCARSKVAARATAKQQSVCCGFCIPCFCFCVCVKGPIDGGVFLKKWRDTGRQSGQ